MPVISMQAFRLQQRCQLRASTAIQSRVHTRLLKKAPRLSQHQLRAKTDDDEEPVLASQPLVTDIPAEVIEAAAVESSPATTTATAVASAPEATYDGPDAAEIKAQLLDSLFGTERGLNANSELRGEINELVTQLEALNPTPSPNDALALLDGEWKLVYTSNSELIALLVLSRLPLVTVGDITQTVSTANMSVVNRVQLGVPFARTSFSTRAAVEVRSPKLLNVRFEQGTVATPQLLEGIELPTTVTVMGQTIDLKPVQDALQPAQGPISDAINNLSKLLQQQPDLTFPISTDQASTWLLTTYLDEDTRITRGDLGSIFVLVKDVSLTEVTLVA